MAFGEKLRNAMERIKSAAFIDKETIKEAIKDIQRALIAADVEVNLVGNLSKEIEKRAFEKPPAGISRREFVIKATYDLLVELLGGSHKTPKKPSRILLLGLFGQGKTTTAAKLAYWYKKRGSSVGLICADVHRPASFEQLKQLSEQAGVEFFGEKNEKNAARIVAHGLKQLKKHDLVIVDSAGRSALDKELIEEIKEVKKAFNPDQTWLVLSADIGQLAKKQANAFNEAVNVNGIILTKTDGSARGGGALAACAETRAPVYFIGTGEKLADLQEFDAQRYLSLVMGYGDLQGLLEKAKEVSEKEALSPEELLSEDFTLKMFYKQLEAAKKMGPLSKVAEMLGLKAHLPKEQLEIGQEKMDSFKVIMDSMTEQELSKPEIINRERIHRIAKGSGKSEASVRELLKQYKQTKKLFDKFKKIGKKKDLQGLNEKDIERLMKRFSPRKKKKFKFR